jgi:tripartite-type tricarboxylate transporter receptor subunit TctC
MAVLTTASAPYDTVSDLLNEAKAKPDSVNVALPSTTARLVLELLNLQGGVTLRAIPYKGSGTSMTDLIGGQIPVAIDTISAARTFIAGGKLKALGVTSLKESALLPGIKTVAAQGVDGFQVIAWNGLYAPRGTPAAVVQKLNVELAKILSQPEVRQRLLELGHEPAGGSPSELGDFARSERQKWKPVIEKAGLRAE